MSQYCKLFTVSDAVIEEIVKQPLKLEKLHYGEILNTDLLESLDNKNEILNWTPRHTPKIFHVEGAFNSINFLLTGEMEATEKQFPLNFLEYVKLGIGEIGWGQASFFFSNDVKSISKEFDKRNKVDLLKSNDKEKFSNSGLLRGYKFTDSDGDDLVNKIILIKDFLSEAVTNELGIYVTIE